MDTSPEHVGMCEKAKEIQALRCNPERNYYDVGDWLAIKDELIIELRQQRVDDGVPNMVANVECYCLCDPDEWGFPSNSIWLPRQDQLQAMLFDKENEPDTERAEQITQFYHFCMQPYRQLFTSMEQLWLAFIMGEKYNKIWDSDKKVWGSG